MEKIEITKNSLCYPEFESLIIIMAALSTAIEYKIKGQAHYNPGDYFTCECLALKKEIRLPLHGPIEAVIKDKKPDIIELTVVDLSPTTMKHTFETKALIKTFEYLITPFFISFYERNYPLAEKKFLKKYSSWPSAWRMGWVFRNALAHNGQVYFKELKTPPISWGNLTISPADQHKSLFSTFVNIGDILFLLLDMEKELK